MSISKRTRPKAKPKRRPIKKSPHVRRCENLYNRLQNDDDESFEAVMSECLGFKTIQFSTHIFLSEVLSRFDAEIKTLQMNGRYLDSNAPNTSYRVALSYADRTKKPKHGYLHPTTYVVKSGPVLVRAVAEAYVEICKNIGRFV